MKLYVVGEQSGDPDTWSIWSEFALVLAESPEQARAIAGAAASVPVAEMAMDKPVLLYQATEPNWGDDL